LIQKSGYFGVSVLDIKANLKYIANFGFKSGREVEKFKNFDYITGKTGVPLLKDHSIANFECKLLNSFDVGTHTIFLGEAIEADIISEEKPMTYDYYYNVVKGKSPSTAPTYHKPQ
jgi:ferric-chelate reductase [NAD(P)H]